MGTPRYLPICICELDHFEYGLALSEVRFHGWLRCSRREWRGLTISRRDLDIKWHEGRDTEDNPR